MSFAHRCVKKLGTEQHVAEQGPPSCNLFRRSPVHAPRHPYPSQVITVKGARDDGLQVDVYAPMTSEIVHTTVVDRRELFALGLRDARVPRPLDRRHEPASARARAGLRKGALRRRRCQGGQFVDAAAAAAALGGGA